MSQEYAENIDRDVLLGWEERIRDMKSATYHCSNCRQEQESAFQCELAWFAEDLIPFTKKLLTNEFPWDDGAPNMPDSSTT